MKIAQYHIIRILSLTSLFFTSGCTLIREGSFEDGTVTSPPAAQALASFNPNKGYQPQGIDMFAGTWRVISPTLHPSTPPIVNLVSATADPNHWFAPTAGNQFVDLSAQNTASGVCQDIWCKLTAGRTYHLAFLQSTYKDRPTVPGSVDVDLRLYTGDTPNLMGPNHTFTLNAGSTGWVKQGADVVVPQTAYYRLTFISSNEIDPKTGNPPAAIIDDVSLCWKP